MAEPTTQTGAHSTLVFYWEDAGFKEDPDDSNPKAFGKDATLQTFSGSRNAVELFEPNTREAQEMIEQQFSGSWAADFVVSIGNPWWNRAVIAERTTEGSEAPYTHTFDGEMPSSLRIVTGNTLSGEDWYMKGAYVANMDININVPGNVEVSLNGAYSSMEEAEPTEQEQQVSDSAEAASFADATLTVGAEVRRRIQSLSLTINNNTDPVLELGSEEPIDFSPKNRALTVDSSRTRDANNDLGIERFLGGGSGDPLEDASEDEIKVDIESGDGADLERLTYVFASSMANEFNINGVGDPDSEIESSITNRPVGVYAEAENPTETAL